MLKKIIIACETLAASPPRFNPIVNVPSGKYLNNYDGDLDGARITASSGDDTIVQNIWSFLAWKSMI